ncbi:DsbA family oxidoreductase [Haloarcula litorea]|uniref:DsbA family oxidoreductase n=1 Tax=Haloarcula litorea TaxID=3032579 RepID=UPI0023E8E580|nr:DsbA family protein [Halomicroarcula sp. GDY20]
MTEATDATVTLTQFTDPMCTWCWGSEPIIRHLQTVYGDQIELRFVMGGLIEDFDDFYDAANDISEPGEVGPHWQEASEHHGMPVDTTIFDEDPAQSTYPASIAYVAARQQSRDKGQRYLRRLREAYATEVRNVNRRDEQLEIARSVGLDVSAFETAVDDGSARAEFQEDLAKARESGVRAFPTYHVDGPDGDRRVSGFQPFERLDAELRAVAPSLERAELPEIREFIDRYDTVATQEVAEAYDLNYGETCQVLESLVDDGDIRSEKRGNGYLWMSSSEGR